ncbi:hypothetical protein P6O00_002070 [Klebsiella michiganensis]|uniref:hypothetical protein n=1 Tax=Klebsiella michiganensis TaxID=1134687 RepID=UPI002938048B|nr:hypothetical protein [Klebsiella michiganensis]ELQ7987716.1 hypothetical protein [Klebsiella michiganensis]
MTDAELAHTKELAFFMVERVFMNPISAKLLSEDWRKEFPDEVAVAERMKALVEALEAKDSDAEWMRKRIAELAKERETKEEQRTNWFQMAQKLGEDLDAAEKRIAELEFIRTSADKVQREFAEELGCAGDNESILQAIEDLKQLAGSRTVTVRLPDCDFAVVQHMSGGSKDYCNGFVDGTQNAIRAMRVAGIDVREAE